MTDIEKEFYTKAASGRHEPPTPARSTQPARPDVMERISDSLKTLAWVATFWSIIGIVFFVFVIFGHRH